MRWPSARMIEPSLTTIVHQISRFLQNKHQTPGKENSVVRARILSSGIWRSLAGKEVFDLLDEDVAAHVADGFGQGELFGAGLDAVLGEAALLNAAVAG